MTSKCFIASGLVCFNDYKAHLGNLYKVKYDCPVETAGDENLTSSAVVFWVQRRTSSAWGNGRWCPSPCIYSDRISRYMSPRIKLHSCRYKINIWPDYCLDLPVHLYSGFISKLTCTYHPQCPKRKQVVYNVVFCWKYILCCLPVHNTSCLKLAYKQVIWQCMCIYCSAMY